MKKWLLPVAVLSSGFGFAQTFSDNFDSYTAGQKMALQSAGTWTTWSNAPGGTEDVNVSNADAASAPNSIYLSSSTSTGGPTDLVKHFGMMNTGQFVLDWNMKVESSKGAYFNLQKTSTLGNTYTMDVYFNSNGTIDMFSGSTLLWSGTYTQGAWFNFKLDINFNTNAWEVLFDNVSQGTFSNPVNQVEAIDIYPVNQTSPYAAGYYIDDFEYTITPYTMPAVNLAVTNVEFDQAALTGNAVTPKVTVRNLGTTTITSFDITLNYNGTNTTQSFTQSIASGATAVLTLTQTQTLLAGTSTMMATGSNVNGTMTDDDTSDDMKDVSITTVMPATGKKVVSEEGTGTWCQWCPRGAVYMDAMSAKYGGYWVGIAVHNGDPMTVADYDASMGSHIAGYPSALVDRGSAIDPSEMEPQILARVQIAPTALITNGATWNATTRELQVSSKAHFVSSATSSYKMAIVITEDDVTGTTSAYNQANAYSGGNSGVMGGFESLSNPVPAAQMHYDHVARDIAPGWNGFAGSFPATVSAGEDHVVTYTFTLPAGWDETKVHIIGMLIAPNGKIDNAGTATIDEAVANGYENGVEITDGNLGIAENQMDDLLSVYPNPATESANLALNLKEQTDVTVTIADAAGRVVAQRTYQSLSGSSVIPVNTSAYNSGIYTVMVSTNAETVLKKLVIR